MFIETPPTQLSPVGATCLFPKKIVQTLVCLKGCIIGKSKSVISRQQDHELREIAERGRKASLWTVAIGKLERIRYIYLFFKRDVEHAVIASSNVKSIVADNKRFNSAGNL